MPALLYAIAEHIYAHSLHVCVNPIRFCFQFCFSLLVCGSALLLACVGAMFTCNIYLAVFVPSHVHTTHTDIMLILSVASTLPLLCDPNTGEQQASAPENYTSTQHTSMHSDGKPCCRIDPRVPCFHHHARGVVCEPYIQRIEHLHRNTYPGFFSAATSSHQLHNHCQ